MASLTSTAMDGTERDQERATAEQTPVPLNPCLTYLEIINCPQQVEAQALPDFVLHTHRCGECCWQDGVGVRTGGQRVPSLPEAESPDKEGRLLADAPA